MGHLENRSHVVVLMGQGFLHRDEGESFDFMTDNSTQCQYHRDYIYSPRPFVDTDIRAQC